MLEWLPSDISGISSSTTTYNIAPAAKLKRYGSTGTMIPAASIVSTPATGSTAPDSTPIKNDFLRLIPSPRSGIEIIAPSGKF